MKPFVRSVLFTGVLTMAASSMAVAQKIPEQLPGSQDSKVENRRMFLDARAPDLPPRYSATEIRKMIYDAKSPDDFRRLADYLDFRSMEFEQKAEVQLKELQRLLAIRYHARIYATQVDNTRELIKRYKTQAQECSARATAYRARNTLGAEMVASSVAVAQTSSSQFEQWYRAKYGRPSPTEVARVAAEQENTAYREEAPRQVAVPANTWFEGWYRAKYGRPSPPEGARIQPEQANTAYREEAPVQAGVPANNWYEGWYRAKFGRPSPLEEMRLKDRTR